jgi:hypothetical protein
MKYCVSASMRLPESVKQLQISACPMPYLIIARCAPVLHVTSWQNAVKAVSGEEILEEVISELTWGMECKSFPSGEDDGPSVDGKHSS